MGRGGERARTSVLKISLSNYANYGIVERYANYATYGIFAKDFLEEISRCPGSGRAGTTCASFLRVRHEAGFTLHLAQQGDKALNAVPMMGFGGAKVLEVVIDNAGNT